MQSCAQVCGTQDRAVTDYQNLIWSHMVEGRRLIFSEYLSSPGDTPDYNGRHIDYNERHLTTHRSDYHLIRLARAND